MITIIIPTAGPIPAAPFFSAVERLALAGFLAGYNGLANGRAPGTGARTQRILHSAVTPTCRPLYG
jgi:hypothetical protein